jgi:hypothetical protein
MTYDDAQPPRDESVPAGDDNVLAQPGDPVVDGPDSADDESGGVRVHSQEPAEGPDTSDDESGGVRVHSQEPAEGPDDPDYVA